MKVIERSTGRTVAEVLTNRNIDLEYILVLIGAAIDPDTLDVYYEGEVYDLEDLDLEV